MNKKIGCFISTIITFILSCLLIYICYRLNSSTNIQTTGQLSKILTAIVTIPVYLIFYCLTLGLITSTLITSIKGLQSSSKFIMITSIVFLILTLALLTICILLVLQLAKVI